MKKNIFIIILVIIILGLCSFMMYEKNYKNSKDENKVEKPKTQKEVYLPELTKGQVEYYLSIVPLELENLDQIKDAYVGTKTFINDIDDETKYGKAYNNTFETDEKPSVTDAHKDLKELMGDSPGSEYYNGVVKADDLEKNIKNMYNISLNNIDKFDYPSGGIFKSGNYYSVYHGSGSEGLNKISDDVKYTYSDTDLIIKEKAIFLFEELDEKNSQYIYTDTSRTEKIGEETYDDSTNKFYMIDKYKNKFTSFKHTFKRNENGNYYWYSTEVE